ncbi:ABC transporter permease [Ruminococcus sp. OA3]|uniref:fluoroquinolone export ABC transporter permease subunit n=1 Tax=Ruminococcus sp. OA3 TaxID=2914164 RepID=UPI001F05CF01|nr:ABC transporter permease [Ruminococcus sp. OA3]MCH1982438.1 ABC transporter permease [Ruminococcus sp. OA3]
MRLWSLTLWDMRFQFKYGFYFLYAILTVFYVAVLSAMPESWQEKVAPILIFSDPAAMGLFFMGAIILLEKSQRVSLAFAVMPVRAMEYVAAKVLSLSVISVAVAAVLAAAADTVTRSVVLAGTAVSSVIFTLLGIIVSTKINSLNQFILWIMPVELISFLPAVLHILGITTDVLRYYPAVICMNMMDGYIPSAMEILILAVLTGVLLSAAQSCVLKMWRNA